MKSDEGVVTAAETNPKNRRVDLMVPVLGKRSLQRSHVAAARRCLLPSVCLARRSTKREALVGGNGILFCVPTGEVQIIYTKDKLYMLKIYFAAIIKQICNL